MKINDLSKDDLIQLLKDFVEGLEKCTDLSAEEQDFITLQKRVIWELSHARIYKVSTADLSYINTTGPREFDIRYFSSLGAAKRELIKRKRAMAANLNVATPNEIQKLGVNASFAPELVKSVITNSDVKLGIPGRFKFYEVRILQNEQIIPVQFILTAVPISSEGFQDTVRRRRTSRSTGKQSPAPIIQFDQIKD